jgi:hypothetical protein
MFHNHVLTERRIPSGFNFVKADFSWFRGRKIDIAATEASHLMLSNKEQRPIFKYHLDITHGQKAQKRSPLASAGWSFPWAEPWVDSS